MFRALQIAASGMSGLQTAMDSVAHNLSNVNTPGFKASEARFEEMVFQGPGGASQTMAGARVAEVHKNFSQGDLQSTGRPLDLAIQGRGFFTLQDGEGGELYARSGSFHTDADGRLVHQSGLVMAGNVLIPDGVQEVVISAHGQVSGKVAGSPQAIFLGELGLTGFTNDQGLQAVGQGTFRATEASGLPLRQQDSAMDLGLGEFHQGALEASNVSMVEEMARLITTQRAYETGAKVLTAADEMLGYANNLRR